MAFKAGISLSLLAVIGFQVPTAAVGDDGTGIVGGSSQARIDPRCTPFFVCSTLSVDASTSATTGMNIPDRTAQESWCREYAKTAIGAGEPIMLYRDAAPPPELEKSYTIDKLLEARAGCDFPCSIPWGPVPGTEDLKRPLIWMDPIADALNSENQLANPEQLARYDLRRLSPDDWNKSQDLLDDSEGCSCGADPGTCGGGGVTTEPLPPSSGSGAPVIDPSMQ